MDSVAAISGLASGLDWRGIVDQLIAIDSSRVKLLAGQKDEYSAQQIEISLIKKPLLIFSIWLNE